MLDYFYHLKVTTKLAWLTGILIGGLIAFGLLTYYTMKILGIKDPYYERVVENKDIIADVLPPPNYIIETYLLTFQIIDEKSPDEIRKYIRRIDKLKQEYDNRHQFWSNTLDHNKEIAKYLLDVSYRPVIQFFNILQDQLFPAVLAGDHEKAEVILHNQLKPLYEEHREAIDKVVEIAVAENKDLNRSIQQAYDFTTFGQFLLKISILTCLFTIGLGILLAYIIGRSIKRGMEDAINHISSISSEIAARMDAQSESFLQQSSSVHETTTAMDELNTSFQHTESLAQESSEQADQALDVAEDGNNLIKKMVLALSDHKDKVGAIVEKILKLTELTKQIHNIASATSNLTNQTNILALNAAVQAAHVKQHSEGFSVIASEIRKLADESKKFLSHIDVLAENIQQATDATILIAEEGNKTVQEGIKMAQESANSFESITSITHTSSQRAKQVSLNVRQQSNAVHQVLEAMEVVNSSAQKTTTGMEQVRLELNKLNAVANEIKKII